MVALLALTGLFRERRAAAREGRRPDLLEWSGLLLAGTTSLAVLLGSYAIAMRHMSGAEAAKAVRLFLVSRQAPEATIDRIIAISRISKEAGHYAAGLAGIAVQNRTGGGVNFLNGKLSVDGFWEYFFVAFAVKSTLATLAVLGIACAVGALRKVRPDLVLFTLVLPPVYLFLTGMATSYNIGIRHMLPVYPLLLSAAVLVLFRSLSARAATAILAVAASVQLVETLRVHPHELSFFNAAAGGTPRTTRRRRGSSRARATRFRRVSTPCPSSSAAAVRRRWPSTATVPARTASNASAAPSRSAGLRSRGKGWDTPSSSGSGRKRAREAVHRDAGVQRAPHDPRDPRAG